MKSLTNNLLTLKQALVAVSTKCYHYEKPAKVTAPYIVWSEDGEDGSFHSDNHTTEQTVTGSVDFYTKTEFDSTIDEIQSALDAVCGWELNTVQYEDETKLIHYSWRFWVS